MELRNQNILFFTRTMQLGGTENVILQLCEIFNPLVSKIVVCSCGGVNVDKLKKMGIEHYSITDIENKSIKTIYDNSLIIKKIVKKEKITVIHTHHRMAAFYVRFLGLYKRCVFINTSHNTFYNKKALTRFAYAHANLVACGEMVKKNLVEYYGIPDSQVTVIRNAVKPFETQIQYDKLLQSLRSEGFYLVGNIGRLSKQKGMEYFVKAVPKIISEYAKVRFIIVGSGEDESKLRDLVKVLDVSEYIYFLGYRKDIQNIMSQLDLVVLSSLWEGLPLTPIEAYSVGKTVVATEVDGTPEIVRDGKDGCLVEPMNSDDIAKKVLWLIKNPDKQVLMQKNAKKWYDIEFSFDKLSCSYISYYERILEMDK